MIFYTSWLIFLLFCGNLVSSQQIYFDEDLYTEFHTGTVNILLSVPHDGQLRPSSITNRTADANNNLLGRNRFYINGIFISFSIISFFERRL